MRYDVAIKNGLVIDGSGNPWFRADIGVTKDEIARIGRISSSEAELVLDATGLVLCPGFIDVHHHSDALLLFNPKAESHVRQGVTTLCVGNCGVSAAPLRGFEKERVERLLAAYGIHVNWSTFAEFLQRLESEGVSTNVASLVGHGTVRSCVLGYEARSPNSGELEEMKDLVDEAMREGAYGLSTGLAYAPGFFSHTEEIKELCKVVRRYGGIYTTHIRNEVTQYKESVREAIEIGRETGVPVQVSHIESHYPAWNETEDVLRLLDDARAEGVDVTCDVPPYRYSATSLATLLPDWAQEGGRTEIRKKMQDAKTREKIRRSVMTEEEVRKTPTMWLAYNGLWDKIVLSECKKDPSMAGQSLKIIAGTRGVDPYELVFDLLVHEDMPPSIACEVHNEDDIRKVVSHPTAMIESDANVYAPYGLLKEHHPHPRAYGTFALAFRKYVRGETRKDLPQEAGTKLLRDHELIRKITSFPALRLGLDRRGLLREGFYADVVVFDPVEIQDTATYENPHQYAKGIRYVLVNGKVVIEAGEHTGLRPGRILRSRSK